MPQKLSGGRATVEKQDLVNNLTPWYDAASEILSGKKQVQCPLCKSDYLKSDFRYGIDQVGFLLLMCPSCKKSARFSRGIFPANFENEHRGDFLAS